MILYHTSKINVAFKLHNCRSQQNTGTGWFSESDAFSDTRKYSLNSSRLMGSFNFSGSKYDSKVDILHASFKAIGVHVAILNLDAIEKIEMDILNG